jgi:hypothetical protein
MFHDAAPEPVIFAAPARRRNFAPLEARPREEGGSAAPSPSGRRRRSPALDRISEKWIGFSDENPAKQNDSD